MKREKLLNEYLATLDSLIEKTKFVYSEEFFKLDEFEKQKYNKDKVATEGHLSTLCNVLWGEKFQASAGFGDMFALGILSSMFSCNSFGSPNPNIDYLKKKTEEDEKKNEEQSYTFPVE